MSNDSSSGLRNTKIPMGWETMGNSHALAAEIRHFPSDSARRDGDDKSL